MNRTIELMKLISTCNQVDGRKKLQKVVHILRSLGYPFEYRYSFHYHGPFSVELKSEIDKLVESGLVSEKEEPAGNYTKYVYSTTEAARQILQSVDYSAEAPWTQLSHHLSHKSAQELEALSTILYLRELGYSDDKLKAEFGKLKPQLTPLWENSYSEANSLPRHQLATPM